MAPRKLLEKPCCRCKQVFPRSEYVCRNKEKDQRVQYCRACLSIVQKEWRSKNKHKLAAYKKAKYTPEQGRQRKYERYGITAERFAEMESAQGGVCAICRGITEWRGVTTLHIDHCHETGRVRGLLCYKCNVGIGQFRDDVEILRSAIRYLTTKS